MTFNKFAKFTAVIIIGFIILVPFIAYETLLCDFVSNLTMATGIQE